MRRKIDFILRAGRQQAAAGLFRATAFAFEHASRVFASLPTATRSPLQSLPRTDNPSRRSGCYRKLIVHVRSRELTIPPAGRVVIGVKHDIFLFLLHILRFFFSATENLRKSVIFDSGKISENLRGFFRKFLKKNINFRTNIDIREKVLNKS